MPGTVDPRSADAESFANGRTRWLSASDRLEDVPVLRVSEDKDRKDSRHNLTYYSYFFYLDDQTRRSVYRMLKRMQAKRELVKLAKTVAGDIGSFNAVHLRRGDFKVTYGVTTLDRQPWEAIEALDQHFKRKDTLVIVTDERNDPFFDEIKAAYPHHLFIDHHILDEYGEDFGALPHRDSIALAYLSQLVAAESEDFIGTMTSTFTAIIQRYRGNRGKDELFKFLWNELPDHGDRLERGRHPVSECIPLDRGIMIEESSGSVLVEPLQPAHLRPLDARMAGELPDCRGSGDRETRRCRPRPGRPLLQVRPRRSSVEVEFEGLSINLECEVPRLTTRLAESFGVRAGSSPARNVIAELEISERDESYTLSRNGQEIARGDSYEELARNIKHEIVDILAIARRRHVWLRGFSFLRCGRALVLIGDLGPADDWLPDAMCSNGWELLWDDVVPIRLDDLSVTPFGRSTWPRGAALRVDRSPYPLAGLVIVNRQIHRRDDLSILSPSVGVAELIANCIDFSCDRSRAVERLCRLVEKRSIGMLTYSDADRGAQALTQPFLQAEQEASRQNTEERQAETERSSETSESDTDAGATVAAPAPKKSGDKQRNSVEKPRKKSVKQRTGRTQTARKSSGKKKTA